MLYQIAYLICLTALTISMIPMALYDIKTHTIKNKVVYAIAFTSVIPIICDCMSPEKIWWQVLLGHIFGGILAFLLMICVGLYVKEGLGGGDIKLLGAIGLWFETYFSLGIAVVSAMIYLAYCVFIEVKFKKQGRKKPKALAFGPFVGIAVLIASIIQSIIILL